MIKIKFSERIRTEKNLTVCSSQIVARSFSVINLTIHVRYRIVVLYNSLKDIVFY